MLLKLVNSFQKLIERESVLLSAIIFLEILICLWMPVERRIPEGHDGIQYFTLQYYFLNNAVSYGEIPQWMPFMMHGTIASWWFLVQASFMQNIYLLTSFLWKDVNFLWLFYIGMFVDELLLLIGFWLLARRFFSSPLTTFFVGVSIMGSCIWATQPWFNFHFYYAIPLILHFFHCFIERAQWRYLILALNLMAMQTIGNLAYYIPVTTLVVFLYFFSYCVFNWTLVWSQLQKLKFNSVGCISLIIIALSFLIAFSFLKIGSDQILTLSEGKNIDGSTPLDVFLSYGGNLNVNKWKELVLGVSPALDYTLYVGLFQVFCILLGMKWCFDHRQNRHFLFVSLVLLVFSLGTWVASFFYYFWPLMKFFRHLALLSPLVKVFLCFLGGFGFELLMRQSDHQRRFYLIGIGIYFYLATWLENLNAKMVYTEITNMININDKLPLFLKMLTEGFYMPRIHKTILCAGMFVLLLSLMGIKGRQNYFKWMIILVLGIHVWDVYSYKFNEMSLRTKPIKAELLKITQFQPMTYVKRRNIRQELLNIPRAQILRDLPAYGSLNWSMYSFLFVDEVHSSLRTDYWMKPLDMLMRAYWGQPITDQKQKLPGQIYYKRLNFPLEHQAVTKIVGESRDKIQFFSKAYSDFNDVQVAGYLTDKTYSGDMLFLSTKNVAKFENQLKNGPPNSLQANERVSVLYSIGHFSSNKLQVALETNVGAGIWMMYSDVWHPFWRVKVNGHDERLWRANLAYKAVWLKPGANLVEFVFESRWISLLQIVVGINAIFWLGVVLWLIYRVYFPSKTYVLG